MFFIFQAQRPEQSVMQALESLSDSQVRKIFSFFHNHYVPVEQLSGLYITPGG